MNNEVEDDDEDDLDYDSEGDGFDDLEEILLETTNAVSITAFTSKKIPAKEVGYCLDSVLIDSFLELLKEYFFVFLGEKRSQCQSKGEDGSEETTNHTRVECP